MKLDKEMGSILGPELTIDGDVKVTGSLLIYGTVNGNIKSQASIRTAKGSIVKGDIIGNNAEIHGVVEGDLIIDGKILLGNESAVNGNLKSGTLVIQEGAKFAGSCDMTKKSGCLIKVKRNSNDWVKFSGIGIQMTVTVIICLYLGKWIGSKYNYEQTGILLGTFFGLFTSIYNLFKQINK